MEKLQKGVYPGLRSTYTTPHVCGKCLEHIAWDWSFCPECGTPTGITEDDAKAFAPAGQEPLPEYVAPYAPGNTVYDRFGDAWVVDVAELREYEDKPHWLFRCGHPGTEDYCALYDWEVVTEADAPAAREKERERSARIHAAVAAMEGGEHNAEQR